MAARFSLAPLELGQSNERCECRRRANNIVVNRRLKKNHSTEEKGVVWEGMVAFLVPYHTITSSDDQLSCRKRLCKSTHARRMCPIQKKTAFFTRIELFKTYNSAQYTLKWLAFHLHYNVIQRGCDAFSGRNYKTV